MSGLLIPVDGDHPGQTREAIERAISLGAGNGQTVHLLSVQLPVSSHVGMFFAESELKGLHQELGEAELAGPRQRLAEAGVPVACHVQVGRRAETIARVAQELSCDTVVMGPDAPAGLASRLFGSVAQQVRHLLGAGGSIRVLGA